MTPAKKLAAMLKMIDEQKNMDVLETPYLTEVLMSLVWMLCQFYN